jgi:hypothetical protein
MHAIRNFILRIFFDSDTPGILRGSLHPVDEDEAFAFVDAEGLLALLQSQVKGTEEASPPEEAGQSLPLD